MAGAVTGPWDAGRERGEELAVSVLALKESRSLTTVLATRGLGVPVSAGERLEWLHGFCAGISTVLLANDLRDEEGGHVQ